MKLSVIGSNGFLSVAIAKYANQAGWDLDIFGLNEPIDHEYDRFCRINLMEAEIDYSMLLESNIIVYASGAGIQANLKENTDLIYSLNVTVPVKICNRLKEMDYKGCFISFGSVFEMGETIRTDPFSETDILTSLEKAPNDYTISKRMFSRFVSSYRHDFTHWHFIIPTIYGRGENSKRLIPYVVTSIKNKEELKFTSGEQIRQYIHVSEIPILINKAYKNNLPSGVYNIPGSEILSVRQIVNLIHEKLEMPIPDDCFGSIQRADIGMKFLALNGTKLKSQIGFIPSISIQDALKEYI